MSDKKATIKAEGAGGTVTEGKVDIKKGNDEEHVIKSDDVAFEITTTIVEVVESEQEDDNEQVDDDEHVKPELNVCHEETLKWFAANGPDKVNYIWSKEGRSKEDNNAQRKKILAQLRSPGGYHEWLMVSQANIFNEWGYAAQIFDNDYRGDIDKIDEVYFTKFTDNKSNKHGKPGSGSAHNDIIKIIKRAHNVDENALDSEKLSGSQKFAIYKKDLQKWAAGSIEQWEYKPGVPAIRTRLSSGRKLPKGLE